MAKRTILLGALNISADPHPPGIYRDLFDAAADAHVSLGGSDWAKITKPVTRESDEPSFYGRILVWTEIDKAAPWLKQDANREATREEKARIVIPDGLDPNFRSFHYTFLEKRHLLVLEFRNELGHSFSAKRAEKFFGGLFATQRLKDFVEVTVTVEPAREALEKIYAIKRLRTLEIFVTRPNPDDLGTETERLLERLIQQGAKDQLLQLHKRAKVETLNPDEDTRMLAEIAARNGYVEGKGTDEDGNPVVESTQNHPKVYPIDVEEGDTSVGAFFYGLRFF